MKSREELIRESLEIEALLLERLGRADEAKEVRARVPVVPKVSKKETIKPGGARKRTVVKGNAGGGEFRVTRRNGGVESVSRTGREYAPLPRAGINGYILLVDAEGHAHQIEVEEGKPRHFWSRKRPKVTVAREGMPMEELFEETIQAREARAADDIAVPGVVPLVGADEAQSPRRPQRIPLEQRELDNQEIEILDYLYRHGFRPDAAPESVDVERIDDEPEGDELSDPL